MKYHIYTTSKKAWAGMLNAIYSANKNIFLEMFIFENDTSKYDFLSALEDKARAGVRVVVILDMIGSKSLGHDVILSLRNAGVEVLFFSLWFKRLHRKMLIVDERVAFVGGVNIKNHFAFWKDLQIRVTGRAVRNMLSSFATMYRQCNGRDGSFFKNFEYISPIKRTRLWFVERGIGKREHNMRKYYTEHVGSAKKKIVIVTPYLLPPRWLTANLHQALLRGVSVEILMPDASDHRSANILNRSFASFFSSLGAKCFFAPGMNHAKAMLIDDESAVIGSQNLDFISFEWNIESGVFFNETNTVKELADIINEWKKDAVLFDPAGRSVLHWYHFVATFLLRMFRLLPLW
ncbi:MAG: phosphatidylserine/phosphatidylglycerophosphate/cardiolipin synthase family protein [Candidatus Taylorbacteria bacterium]